MEKFKNSVRVAANLRLQLAILLILAIFDVIMTMLGLNIGLSEANPLWVRLGRDIYILRLMTVSFFIGFFALVGERYPYSTFYRASRKALVISIIITGIVVLFNAIQIFWAVQEL